MRKLERRSNLTLAAVLAMVVAVVGCTASDDDPEAPGGTAGEASAGAAGEADTGVAGEADARMGGEAGASMAVAADIGSPPPGAATAAAGVTVTGSGIASGAPDVVRVTVGVEVQRETVQAALDEANAATEDVLAVLDELGIAEEDRQTQNFGIHQVMDFSPEGEPSITGYSVSNLIEVTVRDVDALGEVIQQVAEAAGDNARVHGVTFALEEDDELVAAAREAAMADARAAAEDYAELAGRELGELIGIQDQTTSSPRRAGVAIAEDAAAEASVPIAPGEQDVIVQVVVRWGLA